MLQRHLAPTFVKTTTVELPLPTKLPLAPGIDLFIVPGVKQNVCKIELVLHAGKWYEGKVGLSNFASSLLEKGTANKSSVQISEIFDYHGAHLEIHPGYDFVSISLITIKDHLSPLLALLQEILLSPSFPEEEWMIMKNIFAQNLKVSNEKTSVVASKLLRKTIFGENHPYGTSIHETDVDALSIPDFKSYYQSNFRIKSIFICGDLPDGDLAFISSAFVSLFPKPAAIRESVFKEASFSNHHIEKESVQSSLRFGKRSIKKSHEDYAGVLLINHLLGGFFGSRLMKNIREEKGLTYGIHSSIIPFQHDCMLVIEADVNKANLSLAKAEIKKEIARLGNEPVTQEELSLAKNHFVGSLQNELANPFSIADKIKNIELNALGSDYYQQLITKIESLTASQLREVANHYFSEASFCEVSVG